MLNSQNYASDKDVKHVGEAIAPDLDLNDPEVKTYYHQVPGASTHLPDGAAIVFRGGQYSTKNAEIIAYLDKIANKQGTMVFTKSNAHIVAEQKEVALNAAKDAGDSGTQSPVKGELVASPGTESDLTKVVVTTVEPKTVPSLAGLTVKPAAPSADKS